MTDYTIPRANAPIAGLDAPSVQWYNYLSSLDERLASASNSPQLPITGTISKVTGLQSVNSTGLEFVQLTLSGDVDTAGNTQYYGSNATGVKGWNAVSGAFTNSTSITQAVAADGTSSFDLANLADSGVGAALVKITRDAKGRVSGTQAASTTDLAEGTNLYFTVARVLATILTGLSTATNAVITAADSVLVALGKLQAQITATNAVVNPATSAFFTTIAGVPVTTISGDFISVSA